MSNELLPRKYEIIYADPPWLYNGRMIKDTGEETGKASSHYVCLSLPELYEIDVKEITADNALLFLWTTGPFLMESNSVIQHWGFKYSTVAFVWHKQNRPSMGSYTMPSTEFCLVAKKGLIPWPRGTRNERQFFQSDVEKHSKKPSEIRDRITRMFPTNLKLEMFAREQHPGWDVFGNEVEGSISLG